MSENRRKDFLTHTVPACIANNNTKFLENLS